MVGRRTRCRALFWWRPHALVAEEALDAFGGAHERSQFHAAPTGRTLVDRQAEGQTEQLGPLDVATSFARRWRLWGVGERRWRFSARGRSRRFRWNDERTPTSRSRKDTAVAGQVLFRGTALANLESSASASMSSAYVWA